MLKKNNHYNLLFEHNLSRWLVLCWADTLFISFQINSCGNMNDLLLEKSVKLIVACQLSASDLARSSQSLDLTQFSLILSSSHLSNLFAFCLYFILEDFLSKIIIYWAYFGYFSLYLVILDKIWLIQSD